MRPIAVGDVEHIQRCVDDRRVSDNLSYTPHPYTMEMAENWVRSVNGGMQNANCCYWTISDAATGRFIGSMGLSIFREQDGGELHYWISANEWNRGYCTEASKRVIRHFFEDLGMHRLAITHRECNLGSKAVVAKCGFIREGNLRESLKRFGKFENVITYSMLRDEYLAMVDSGTY
jgi:RimJ/RimL family protein N-acetyltransferase